jgi:hypothetical protein
LTGTVTIPTANITTANITTAAVATTATVPTVATGDNSTNAASTAFVKAQAYAPLASPALTGTPTAPTPATADSTTKLATTAYVRSMVGAGATFQGYPGNPAATVSTSGVMMGLGATCKITPTYSSRIYMTIFGGVASATAAAGFITLRAGTGVAPVNGAAPVGNVLSNSVAFYSAVASASSPFSLGAIFTGLTPGTTYWFDIELISNAGNSVSINALSGSAYEL